MNNTSDIVPAVLTKNRIEALTDAIFAIAMTLLVLGIAVPHGTFTPGVEEFLMSEVQEIIEFSMAFLVLAVFWVLHHLQFQYMKFIDNEILWLNISALFFVSVMPFSTSLADVYQGSRLAEIIIGLNVFIIGIIYLLQWLHAAKDHGLVEPHLTAQTVRLEILRNMIVPVFSIVGVIISLIGLGPGLIIYLGIPVIMVAFPKIGSRF